MLLQEIYCAVLFLFLHVHPTTPQIAGFEITSRGSYLLEDTRPDTIIAVVTCNQCTCLLSSSVSTIQFHLNYFSQDTYYVVYWSGVLSVSITVYVDLTVSCYDNASNNDSSIHRVFLRRNYPPTITSGSNGYDSIHLNSKQPYVKDDVVYRVGALDDENDLPLTFTLMTTTPSTSIFKVGVSGNVSTNVDLRSVLIGSVQLLISVSDSKGHISQFTLVITITLNKPPDITNLPQTVSIEENRAIASPLIHLTIVDPDDTLGGAAPLTTSCVISPAAEAYKFDISSDFWYLKQPLDFEKTKEYKISCVASDTFLNSESKIFTVKVTDVNEAPYFLNNITFCSLDESKAGVSSCTLDVKVADPDGDDVTVIGVSSSTSVVCRRFSYDMSTHRLTFSVDYDLEVELIQWCDIYLEARDERSMTSSNKLTVKVTINDVNDHTCSMPTRTISPNWYQIKVPSTLATLQASDLDLTDPNNKLTYELVSAQPSEAVNYFSIARNGELIYIQKIPEANSGQGYTLQVKCMDGGRPQRSAEVTVLINYEWTTTPATTMTTTPTPMASTIFQEDSGDDVFDNVEFVIVFAILITILVVVLAALLYYLIRYRGLCGPTMQRIQPSQNVNNNQNFFPDARAVTTTRLNSKYEDNYWNNNDNFETGAGQRNSQVLGVNRLALPPPHSKPRPAFS